MNKNTNRFQETYHYSDVLNSINEGMNIWDFATKYGINFLEKAEVLKLIRKCTNDDEKDAEEFMLLLLSNTQIYVEEENIFFFHNNESMLTYDTLLYYANKEGYSRNEMMKWYGKTSYQAFSKMLNRIFRNENISSELVKNLRNKIIENSKVPRVVIIPDPTSDVYVPVKKTQEKLVVYTIEHLRQQSHAIENIFTSEDEHVILSCTLSRFMKHNNIKESAKIALNKVLNSKKADVVMVNSEYGAGSVGSISIENDFVLSQAIKISSSTPKKIFIATANPQTALNALSLGFGIRVPISTVNSKFANIIKNKVDEFENYFDYELNEQGNNFKAATILDTCILINNSNNTLREKILSDTTQEKILTRVVLDEIVEKNTFFSTIFTVKCNPTITLNLDTVLKYNVNDIAILNYAMWYKYKTGKDVTIITHDMHCYIESLKYDMKAKYFPSTYMDTFKVEAAEEKEETKKELEPQVNLAADDGMNTTKLRPSGKTVYYEHINIQMVSSRPVIFEQNKVVFVKSGSSLENIQLLGRKGKKYYPVQIGDVVSLKDDPNLYQITSFSGKRNLQSIEL